MEGKEPSLFYRILRAVSKMTSLKRSNWEFNARFESLQGSARYGTSSYPQFSDVDLDEEKKVFLTFFREFTNRIKKRRNS
ncbi:hypothetical protein DLM75_01660 [Leptospira stimsonii]|uniref:Uncharacterized protein n=1 Tax=Leptospira stimsonii TaxID=2202203 RepID=A0A396ZE26_9LEPT|nr:hypothetical protein DLM75_01660 [Leptospira stimsonii]